MLVPVTLLYGSLCALLVTILGINVSRMRVALKSFVGDPSPNHLLRAVRAHGNAAEYVAVGVVMLALLELTHACSNMALHILGGAFLLGRAMHAGGLMTKSPVTAWGATLTYLSLLTMSGWGLYAHFVR